MVRGGPEFLGMPLNVTQSRGTATFRHVSVYTCEGSTYRRAAVSLWFFNVGARKYVQLWPHGLLTGLSIFSSPPMTLQDCLAECMEAVDLFLNNRFTESLDKLRPQWAPPPHVWLVSATPSLLCFASAWVARGGVPVPCDSPLGILWSPACSPPPITIFHYSLCYGVSL